MLRKARAGGEEVLERLNSYLEAEDTEPVEWLTRTWNNQQKAITYKELREAILAGQISENTIEEWTLAYSKLVTNRIGPMWREAMIAANQKTTAARAGFFFDPTTQGVKEWINTHGSEWVTRAIQDQRYAINSMIWRAYSGDWTVEELSRVIRPTIGLTWPQANANANYYEHIKASLLKNNPTMREATAAKRAQEAAYKYAGQQHRQRAYTIATTEMAFAYNKGADEGIRQAQEKGYIGQVKRIWSTAADERVCEICGALEGKEVGFEEEFEFKGRSLYGGQKQTPPAHPRCRCAILYEEVRAPEYDQPWLGYDEEAAINRYISSDSYKINEKLRQGVPISVEDYNFMIYTDIALTKMPKFEGTLTRSLQFIDDEAKKAFLKQHIKGNVIEYSQYISTTKGSIYNPEADVQIIIKGATKGRDISAYNPGEKEILYERLSSFRVIDINKAKTGAVIITLEEVLP
jgi:hypothetical protein